MASTALAKCFTFSDWHNGSARSSPRKVVAKCPLHPALRLRQNCSMANQLARILLGCLLATSALPLAAHAEDIDQAISEASADLTDKARRQKILNKDANANKADAYAAGVTGGGAHQEELYAISAEILPEIAKMAENDPAKMAALLQEAQKNPEAFYKKLPAEKRKRIQELSKKIEGAKKRP